MGWFIEALANTFLEILGDLLSWTTNLITGLSLDHGMETTIVNGRYVPTVPDIGTIIVPWRIRGGLLESTFPLASSFCPLFLNLALVIVGFIFIFKMMGPFLGPFTRSQSGAKTVVRTSLAIFGVYSAYTLFVMFESLFNAIYNRFMDKYLEVTAGTSGKWGADLAEPQDTSIWAKLDIFNWFQNKGEGEDVISNGIFNGRDLIESYTWGQGTGLTIIEIALFSILLICYLKLVLEIYERYVMIGVMFYTAPLAFSSLAAEGNDIFQSWIQMLLSEFVVMCSNLFFTGVFIASWANKINDTEHAFFATPNDFIMYMFLMISWLMIGQQFDQHLKGLGLSTAQTGQGLGGAVVAGLGTAAMVGRGVVGAGIGAGRMAGRKAVDAGVEKYKGGDGFQSRTAFSDVKSKGDADKHLSDIMNGQNRAFSSQDQQKKGAGLANLASASMGEGQFQKAIGGAPDTASLQLGSNGVLTGRNVQGEPFSLQTPMSRENYRGDAIGSTGWKTLPTKEQAQIQANKYAASMPREIEGMKVSWTTDPSDASYSTVIAVNDDLGRLPETATKIPGASGEKFYEG